MLAGLVLDEGIIASRVLEGSFTHDTFLEYLRDDLVCLFLIPLLVTIDFSSFLLQPLFLALEVSCYLTMHAFTIQMVTDLVHSFGKCHPFHLDRILS